MTLELLYNSANLFVLPFWLLIIVLPNWGITRKIMGSFLPFVPLAGLYLYLFVGGVDPETAESFSNPNLQLADLASLFANPKIMAAGWVHFLVMDLFVGRWIYWEGQRTGVWTIHSLILCLFAGPLGLLSHLSTNWISQKFFRKSENLANPATDSSPAASS